MARLIDLITFSGAVGNVVGCNGPHGFYVRSRPRKSDKAPTSKQLETRAKFALVMAFLKPLKEIIYKGFLRDGKTNSRTSAMNAAASRVHNHAITGEYPDLAIDPAKVLLSRGTLSGLYNPAYRLADAILTVTWYADIIPLNAYSDDRVWAVVYNPVEKTVMANEAIREVGQVAVDVADEPPGSELLVYVCVCDRDGKRFSKSQYLGQVVR